MAERAPGQDAPRQETSCYNCGSKDHFAFACPEPTRSEPAGLEAFRQRQAAKQAGGGSGNSSRNHKSKGPIITRYGPPPPPPGAPVTGYSPWPSAPPTPGQYPGVVPFPPQAPPPTGLPTPPAYPPAPPVPAPYPGYPPPNPHVLGYGPVITGYQAPPPAYPAYGPPGQPPPLPPGPPYAPPAPYAPSGHNLPYFPAQPYQAPPQPYYAGPPPLPTPPAYADPAQPPLGGYPTPPYNQPYAQPYVPAPPPQYPASYPESPPAWNQSPGTNPTPNHHHHRGGRHHNRNKGRHNNQPRSSSHTHPPSSHTHPSVGSDPIQSRSPAIVAPKVANKVEPAPEDDADFQWHLEKAFVDLERKPADPVGKPLPAEWNDDPTIPPAFNATCVKSEYFSENDAGVFSKSIRGTGAWDSIKGDPSFQLQQGMVTVHFQDHPHEYFVYDIRRRTDSATGKWSVVWREAVTGSSGSLYQSTKRGREDDDESHESKRYKVSPRSPPRRQSPAYEAGSRTPGAESSGDPWAAPPGGSATRDRGSDPTDKLFNFLSGYGDGAKQRPGPERSPVLPHESTQRHDSGYQSSHSRDPQPRERRDQPASPPGQRKALPVAQSSPESRSRSESQPPAARREGYSPSRRREDDGDDSDASSQMSDIEYELLGMDRPEKEARPKKPRAAGRGPMKRRQVRINDAFGRRW